VYALAEGPARERVAACLLGLVRKELVRPYSASFAGEDAFRFRHVLIREAAYESIPKQLRAQLHDRFAAWLEDVVGERAGEYEELLGYHLEQAFQNRVEISRIDDWARAIALRGGWRLASAGRRALGRGDASAAANLLGRARSLLTQGGEERVEVLLDLGAALCDAGELASADDVLAEALTAAHEAEDEGLEARALVRSLTVAVQRGAAFQECLAQTRQAIGVLERVGDDLGLAQALAFAGKLELWLGQSAAAASSFERALVHAQRAGDRRDEVDALIWLLVGLVFGATPATEGVTRCDQILESAGGEPQLEACALITRGGLYAMQGRTEDARVAVAHGREVLHDLGAQLLWAAGATVAGSLELIAGDERAAEQVLRPVYELLEQIGGAGYLSTVAAYLAEALYRQSREEEAGDLTRVSEEAAAPDDFESQASWRAVRAKLMARGGETREAEALAREAVRIAERTDYLDLRGRSLLSLAEVLRLDGQNGAAVTAAEEATALFEQKGNTVMARAAREFLERSPTPGT
jgi:tetratricopeptide (TPR) repeat protein